MATTTHAQLAKTAELRSVLEDTRAALNAEHDPVPGGGARRAYPTLVARIDAQLRALDDE
jgi:hypothetical protein